MKSLLLLLLVFSFFKASSQCTPSVDISVYDGFICSASSNYKLLASPTNGGTTPTYQWQKNGVNVGSNSTNRLYPEAGLVAGDSISVIMTSNEACASPLTATASYIIRYTRVVFHTTLTSNPSGPIVPGTSVTFTGHNNQAQTLAYSYEFYVNGVKKAMAQTNQGTFTYTTNTLADGDVVYCTTMVGTAVNKCGSVDTSASIIMQVVPPCTPSVSINVYNGPICSASSRYNIYAIPVNGGTSPTYQWQKNGVNVGSNSTNIAFPDTGLVAGDSISVIMTSNAACASPLTASAYFKISYQRADIPVSLSANPSGPILPGTNVTFTGTALNGNGRYYYFLHVNNTTIYPQTIITSSSTFSFTLNNLNDGDVVFATTQAPPAVNPCGTIDTSNSIVMSVNTVLPISLSQFDARASGNKIVLSWTTSTEVNSAYFNVQEGSDGVTFATVGKVAAAGNSSNEQSYGFTFHPAPPFKKPSYFRLQLVNKDGSFVYSYILPVTLLKHSKMTVSPNPAKDIVNVNSTDIILIQLFDMAGKLVLSKNTSSNNTQINVSKLAPGMYLLRATDIDGGVQIQNVVIH